MRIIYEGRGAQDGHLDFHAQLLSSPDHTDVDLLDV